MALLARQKGVFVGQFVESGQTWRLLLPELVYEVTGHESFL